MFSKFFIERPIFATVLAIIMVLAGLLVMMNLPITQYPDIAPPTVMVSASYPGADAKTVAQSIGVPIEQQVNGIDGMLYMSSNSSSDGSYSLTITFENGTDLDEASVEVQNRINEATAQLPSAVKEQGISVNKQSSTQLLFCSLESDDPERYDALYLNNYSQLNLMDPLSRVKGVGSAETFGAGQYSMRVWLDPEAMRIRKITPEDVATAIQSQNMEVSGGSVGTKPSTSKEAFEYTIVSPGELTTAEEFGNIILRTDEGGVLRLKDVAKVELGSEQYSIVAQVNGKPTALIAVSQTPGANAIETAQLALAELDRLSQYFPDGVHYRVILNTTTYINKSIDEVLITFVETSLIVLVVILIFLQNWRAVVIPMLTIPVSLIGTFIVMKLLGFTINTLTLFGLVLAIAIVVDDAIVVVEDCSRIVDKGQMTRKQAAEQAMRELTGPVVGEVLVLLSVFIPTAFISGITGQLYKQFALTIAVSTAISGFNALTLTPALCALFLNPRKPSKFFIYNWFNKGWNAVESLYKRIIGTFLRHDVVALLLFLGLAALGIWGYSAWPSSFIPQEDQGYFMTTIQLPPGASLDRTQKIAEGMSRDIKKEIPQVKDVMMTAGGGLAGNGSNSGMLFVVLQPWNERKGPEGKLDAIMAKVDEISARYQDAMSFSLDPPAIPGLGASSGLQMQLLDINNLGPDQLKQALAAVQEEARKDSRIASVTSTYQGTVPQYQLTIDRNKAKLIGLTLEDIYGTLSGYMGSEYVNDFVDFGRMFQVTMSAEGNARSNIQEVLKLSVRNADGNMVPFSAFCSIEPVMGQPTVSRYNMYTTASLTATPAHGTSSQTGIQIMEDIVDKALGKNYSYAWTGEAYQETSSGTTILMVLIFAVIMTILVLAAQYESWTDPIAVVLSMPIAVLGTVLGCLCMDQSISIYTQIGLILLLGLSAKNAILIVEYAVDFRKSGVDITKAAEDAGVIRFRPIMMTALAFVFGVMPMMFATGPGANSRIAIGTAVVFGMALNALIGTLFVPNFWKFMQTIQEKYLSGLFKDKTPAAQSVAPDSAATPAPPSADDSAADI